MIKVGKVLKAQGIKGEVKVSCLLDDAQMLKNISQLYFNGVPHKIEKFRADGNCFFVQLAGIADRNAAENLRGWEVTCAKEEISLPDGRYFVADIVGCSVTLDDGGIVGKIAEVLQYGAADVYVCRGEMGEVSFPALKDLLLSVNTKTKSIVLSAQRFEQVALRDGAEEIRDEN